jgi:hypothetical protein
MMVVKNAEISIEEVKVESIDLALIGQSPFIMHRYARKAFQELMLPKAPMNKQAKAENIKHYPLKEYQECFYMNSNDDEPTLFHVPVAMIQGALSSVALDLPGIRKSEAQRWISVTSQDEDMQLNLFGVPELYTTMAKNSGMTSVPDPRTRPIFRQWVIPRVRITYKANPLNDTSIANLAHAAGRIVGIGDWRPQKGGPYGKFLVAQPDDPRVLEIIEKQGRHAQELAFDNPTYFDRDTADINKWFEEEIKKRGQTLEPVGLKAMKAG